MDVVSVDREVLFTRREGEPTARALVCVNAIGTDLRLWEDLVPYLSDAWRVVRHDTRGHGLSTGAHPPPDLDTLADDVAAVMDQSDTGPAVVLGCELGAATALVLAGRRPDLVAGLVLTGAAARAANVVDWRGRMARVRAAGIDAIADEVLADWLPARFRAARPHETRLWRTMLTRTPPAGLAAAAGVLADADAGGYADRVPVPTLLLVGGEAAAGWRRATAEVGARIAGAEATTIADAALLTHVAQPAPTAAAIVAFLERNGLD